MRCTVLDKHNGHNPQTLHYLLCIQEPSWSAARPSGNKFHRKSSLLWVNFRFWWLMAHKSSCMKIITTLYGSTSSAQPVNYCCIILRESQYVLCKSSYPKTMTCSTEKWTYPMKAAIAIPYKLSKNYVKANPNLALNVIKNMTNIYTTLHETSLTISDGLLNITHQSCMVHNEMKNV